jgi:hypothetical protein
MYLTEQILMYILDSIISIVFHHSESVPSHVEAAPLDAGGDSAIQHIILRSYLTTD